MLIKYLTHNQTQFLLPVILDKNVLMTLYHLERLLYFEGEVAAPLLLPPVVGHVGIADDIWLSEAGVEMEGYSVIVFTQEIDLKP